MDFNHFIIIRFSTIFNERGEFNEYKKTIFNKDKLNIRFELFEKFSLWTIINQSLINYKVIIIYDKDLPEEYYNKLFELTKDYNFIILHKWNNNDLLEENKWLECYLDKSKKYLITSRFDDDDILHYKNNEYMINIIKKKGIENLENTIITFCFGKFIYYENNNYSISDCNYPTPGLWLSYISKIDEKINIYGMDHCKINKNTIKIINKNNFGILNHHYGNDKRIIRYKKSHKNKIKSITLNEIYELFSK